MGANSKVRRDAKRKRDAVRQRRRHAEQVFELDLPGALRLWYGLGAGEYADQPDEEQLTAIVLFSYLARIGLFDDADRTIAGSFPPGLTVSGIQAVANDVPADVRADLVADLADRARNLIAAGVLTRLSDGTVIMTEPVEGAG